MAQSWLATATLLIAVAIAQQTAGNICLWQEARSGVVRDSLYIEGGLLSTYTGKGCSTAWRRSGSLFQMNFSTPFDSTSNLTRLFNPLNETLDDSAATYVNGFMVADNDEWYTFGGQAYPDTDSYSIISGITRYALYQPNPTASRAGMGPKPNYQPQGNMTNRYISNGAGVSIPSESLGFYYSGLQSANMSNLSYTPAPNGYNAPTTLVSSMLKVDTSVFGESTWSTIPLPSNILPRAEATLAWVPAGPKGALIVIGGVPKPVDLPLYLGCSANQTVKTANANSAFMTNITVYDVATGRWYTQATSGSPPAQLAQACAVVATSSDNSTHNIYIYGGYNGNDGKGSDDVWVLSVPSFTWIKVASGTAAHGRYSHVCAKPYPDQMFVVGGTTGCGNALDTSAIVDVFNLNTLKWTGSYDPSKWSEYVVPTTISDAIKAATTASMDGAASVGSMDSGLLALFKTPYPSALPRWYPYVTQKDPNVTPPPSQSGWVVPVAASIGALVGIVAIGLTVWCCCFRRRKSDGSSTGRSRHSIFRWGHGVTPAATSQRSDDDMTQVDQSPVVGGPQEIYTDYFKPRNHTTIAELQNTNSEQHLASPQFSSTVSSPNRPPWSPSSELPADVTRHELPAEPFVGNTPIIKSHPYYPPSLGRDNSQSEQTPSVVVSSPSDPSDARMSPYELPLNRSHEELLPQPPADQVLSYSHSNTTTQKRKPVQRNSHPIAEEPISPENSTGEISRDLGPVPTSHAHTPPTQHIPSHSHQQHHRNNSSLDSGFTNLSSPSPREDQRRSVAIAALPDSPDARAAAKRSTDAGSSFRPPFTKLGAAANVEQRIHQGEIRRKDITNWSRQSAYKENEELLNPKNETV